MIRLGVDNLLSRLMDDFNVRSLIATRAYDYYLTRGSEPGYEMEDWVRAESEILEMLFTEARRRAALIREGKRIITEPLEDVPASPEEAFAEGMAELEILAQAEETLPAAVSVKDRTPVKRKRVKEPAAPPKTRKSKSKSTVGLTKAEVVNIRTKRTRKKAPADTAVARAHA